MKKLLFVKRNECQKVENLLKSSFNSKSIKFVTIKPGIAIFNHRIIKIELELTDRVVTFD